MLSSRRCRPLVSQQRLQAELDLGGKTLVAVVVAIAMDPPQDTENIDQILVPQSQHSMVLLLSLLMIMFRINHVRPELEKEAQASQKEAVHLEIKRGLLLSILFGLTVSTAIDAAAGH